MKYLLKTTYGVAPSPIVLELCDSCVICFGSGVCRFMLAVSLVGFVQSWQMLSERCLCDSILSSFQSTPPPTITRRASTTHTQSQSQTSAHNFSAVHLTSITSKSKSIPEKGRFHKRTCPSAEHLFGLTFGGSWQMLGAVLGPAGSERAPNIMFWGIVLKR